MDLNIGLDEETPYFNIMTSHHYTFPAVNGLFCVNVFRLFPVPLYIGSFKVYRFRKMISAGKNPCEQFRSFPIECDDDF